MFGFECLILCEMYETVQMYTMKKSGVYYFHFMLCMTITRNV